MTSARILCGDVRDVLPTLADASVDCIVTDPPYGETSLKWDKRVAGWPALARRLLKPHGSLWVFGSFRSLLETREDFGDWRLAQDVVWEKQNGSGFCVDRFLRVHEIAAHFYPADWATVHKDVQRAPGVARPSARIKDHGGTAHRGKIGAGGYEYTDERLVRSVVYEANCHGGAIHPTQKPLGILRTLIRYSCPPGGVVLDLFAGSGSTLLAAKLEGRSAIGIEGDPDMAAKARKRLDEDAPLLSRAGVA